MDYYVIGIYNHNEEEMLLFSLIVNYGNILM